ncbi:MAG: cation transporter [Actinobacteria bacterium]|nr:cation transporter [Actinomycetota bacterium]
MTNSTLVASTRRGLRLEYLTIGWNIVEGIVAIGAGVAAGSIALVVFGLDSFIEVGAAGVVVWQLKGADEERERRALRLIALTFFALAVYVAASAGRELILGERPRESILGIVVATSSLVVMPVLGMAKRRTAQQLGNSVLLADSAETLFCSYLSAIVLVGLGLNAVLGWWWADPVAACGIAVLAVREGSEAWRGDTCC